MRRPSLGPRPVKAFRDRTTYAVWEITLKCNLACGHCGSRAGDARVDELSTEEALDLARQLAEVGIHEVTLIGGEAYLRPDWLEIAAELTRLGITVTTTTGGLAITPRLAEKMREAGIQGASISVDGLEATHDALRGVPGSHHAALRAMKALREAGLHVACNTQINRRSWPELPALYEILRDAGMHSWQVQLTVPMGHAADNAEILLQPYDLLEVFPLLAELGERARADGVRLAPGNNVGYYGPYDGLLKGQGLDHPVYYTGCEAGTRTLGIEADGTIKGCPSLPTQAYRGGNVRELSLAEIMADAPELQFNFAPRYTPESVAHLWGFCAGCEFRELCRAGCN